MVAVGSLGHAVSGHGERSPEDSKMIASIRIQSNVYINQQVS
jgi:hypothetical protein